MREQERAPTRGVGSRLTGSKNRLGLSGEPALHLARKLKLRTVSASLCDRAKV